MNQKLILKIFLILYTMASKCYKHFSGPRVLFIICKAILQATVDKLYHLQSNNIENKILRKKNQFLTVLFPCWNPHMTINTCLTNYSQHTTVQRNTRTLTSHSLHEKAVVIYKVLSLLSLFFFVFENDGILNFFFFFCLSFDGDGSSFTGEP